jgi:hypothetical protein
MLTWADGAQGPNHERLLLLTSTNGGASFSGPTALPLAVGDRPYYTAPAISPNGADVYITYNAFTTPFRTDTSSSRGLIGVTPHADVSGGAIGPGLARSESGTMSATRPTALPSTRGGCHSGRAHRFPRPPRSMTVRPRGAIRTSSEPWSQIPHPDPSVTGNRAWYGPPVPARETPPPFGVKI